jgi:hypothetical protein
MDSGPPSGHHHGGRHASASVLLQFVLDLSVISVAYALAINPTLAALADTVDRCAIGAYASVYAIFNIVYSTGTIGGDLATIALVHHFSLRTSFLVLSAVLIATLPLIRWGFKPRAVPSSARLESDAIRGSLLRRGNG